DDSEVIAVANFACEAHPDRNEHSVELDLTRIIKGGIKPGKYRVYYRGWPDVENNPEFVVFLGTGLRWRFMALPLTDANRIADGVLRVEGGYVCPSICTLAQIETFVKDHALAYTIRGPLCFPERGRPGWRPSRLEIEVSYDAITGYATVQGLPELKGF